jgi:hypothetical protein
MFGMDKKETEKMMKDFEKMMMGGGFPGMDDMDFGFPEEKKKRGGRKKK